VTFDAPLKLQNLVGKKQKGIHIIVELFGNIVIFILVIRVPLYLRRRFAVLLLASWVFKALISLSNSIRFLISFQELCARSKPFHLTRNCSLPFWTHRSRKASTAHCSYLSTRSGCITFSDSPNLCQ